MGLNEGASVLVTGGGILPYKGFKGYVGLKRVLFVSLSGKK